jgi:hypothetical protein
MTYPSLVTAMVLARRAAKTATLFTAIDGKNRWESLTRPQLLYLIETAIASLRAMEGSQ